MKFISVFFIAVIFSIQTFGQEVPSGKPDTSIDLATVEGTAAVKGQWKYSDTKIVATDFNAAGSDNQPSGPAVKTYDYLPKAGGADFDDAAWVKIAANDLQKRRGNGRLSFNWYRIN